MSVAYVKLPVRIVAIRITAAFNGGTHMPLEDVGVVRNSHHDSDQPVDNVMMRAILQDVVDLPGPVYLRVNRKQPVQVYSEGTGWRLVKAKSLEKVKT